MKQSLQTLDDRALWERACRGEEGAWQVLRDRFGPGMTALLLGRAEPEAVGGVLDEVFGNARGQLQRIPDPSAVGRWLLQQARTHPVGGRGAVGGDAGRMLGRVRKLDDEVAEAVLLEAVAGLDADGIADLLYVRRSDIERRLEQGREQLGPAVDRAALAGALETYRYRAKPPRRSPVPWVYALILVGLFGGAVLIVKNLPRDPEGWRVAWTSGAKGQDYLAVGGRLETSDEQRARLALGDAGHVDVEPGSVVERKSAVSDREQLVLEQGALQVQLDGAVLRVTTPSARIQALGGGAYVLEADADGDGLVGVQEGAVEISSTTGPATYVPAGASCRLLAARGAGVPSFDHGPPELKGVTPEGAVAAALMATTPRDALVLWSLLPRIAVSDRELVVTKLAELVPPPNGVQPSQIIALDSKAMASWEKVLRTHW